MANPAFIVEGHQEQHIIQALCKDCKVVRLKSNSKFVTYGNLAKQIHEEYLEFGNRHYPIFVIFDREKRNETVEEIIELVSKELSKLQPDVKSTYIFGIPDRKLESWILPFIGEDGRNLATPTNEHEGTESQKLLAKRLFSNNIHYSKTSTGVSTFLNAVNPRKLAEISPSFKLLFDNGKKYCRWFNHKFK